MKHFASRFTAFLAAAALLAFSPPLPAQVTLPGGVATKTQIRELNDQILAPTVLTYTDAYSSGTTLARSTATLTSDNTNVSNNDTATFGSKTYTFKTALTPTEGEVLIGGSADASLLNLINAINHTGTPNTDYKCAAANTQFSAATSVTAHAFVVTAVSGSAGKAGDLLATTETAAHLSFAYTTAVGGGSWKADGNTASNYRITLTANNTIDLQKHRAGRVITLFIKQDGTGSRIPLWDSTIRWSGGTAPTLTTTAGRTDVIRFIDTGTYYLGSTVALNYNES